MRGRWLAACAAIASGIACALLAGVLVAPAAGVTNLYAAQQGTTGNLLSQYAVAPSGALTALAPAALDFGAQDLAIAPDGRFAYVTRSSGTDQGFVAQFARAADGRMEPAGVVAAGTDPRGILVTPQGTRVIYANALSQTLHVRHIGAGGALDAPTVVDVAGRNPRFLAMTPSGTSLYVSVAGAGVGITGVLQFDVDPASGAVTPKAVPFVPWPGAGPPAEVTRMTVAPDGRHLYAASSAIASGIARFDIDAAGALGGASLVAVPTDRSATSVIAIAPNGLFAWTPTSAVGSAPGQIRQFSRDPSNGLLAPLFLPAVDYRVEADQPARDAVPSPGGSTLYIGQDRNVGEWTISSGGALLPAANLAGPVGGVTNAGIALAPSQAPVASLTAAPAPAGQATTFDARSSSDPDGTVARYDWDFGDGSGLADGGPLPSHVYASAGLPRVTLTVTDADGTSTSQLWTGSRMVRNGGATAQTSHVLQIVAPATPPPPPPPPAGPAPDKGASVTVTRVSGIVLVRVRGSKRYVDLRTLTEIPLGSRIDARRGQVRLEAEVDARTHATQSSLFYAGIFDVSQTKGSAPILVARIVGGTFAGCRPRRAGTAVARLALRGALAPPFELVAKRKRSKRVVRRLWGRGKGSFRTTGKRSSATVRGTWWLVEDRCDGTLTRVREGRVDVRDARLKKTIALRAGKRSLYLAKAP
jgi:PKD repeat protein/DNA-binding beta-propeller fold protein YncE